MFKAYFTILVALIGFATAHFNLTYPPTRGFVGAQEVEAPCGGFNSVGTRTPFPLGDAFIKLDQHHASAVVLVLLSIMENPTHIRNFTRNLNGSSQAPLRDWQPVTGGEICIGVNIASMGYPNATEGTNATISVQAAGGDGDLFQCTDIVLTSNATLPSNSDCVTGYSTTASGTGATTSPSPTEGGSERTQFRAIAAASLIGTIGLVLLAL